MKALTEYRVRSSFVAAAAIAALGMSGVASAAISGSAHDFTDEGWNTTTEICVVCHTPHDADNTVTDAPLWNHEVSTAIYTAYDGSTLDANPGQPDGVSKLCLSCHDGTVALDNFGGTTTGTTYVTGDRLKGINLSDDHPISFVYDTTLSESDGELHDPATVSSGLGGTIAEDLLFGGSLQCASCHDVHNGFDEANLLVKSNAASALCLTCHDK